MRNKLFIWGLIILSLGGLTTSCDKGRIVDEYESFEDAEWLLKDSVTIVADIPTGRAKYDLTMNMRNTDVYPYSNVYVMISHKTPTSQPKTYQRLQFKLADDNGQWLGSGIGSTYDNQISIAKDVPLTPGKHTFVLSQGMRENPLPGISEIGLRITLSEEKSAAPNANQAAPSE